MPSILKDKQLIEYLANENLTELIGKSFKHYYHTQLLKEFGPFNKMVQEFCSYNTFNKLVDTSGQKADKIKLLNFLELIFKKCLVGYNLQEKEWSKLNILDSQNIKSGILQENDLLHFICYYWNEKPPEKNAKNDFNINLGYLSISCQKINGKLSFENSNAVLKLFDDKGEKATLNSNNIVKVEKNLFIDLFDVNQSFIHSRFSLFVGNSNKVIDWEYVSGTYSTVARTHNEGEALAGLIILEKIESKPTFNLVQNKRLKPSATIFHYLYKTRLSAQIITSLESIRSITEIDEISKYRYSAIYIGHFLRNDTDEKKQYIEPLICKIFPNGHMEMSVKENADSFRNYKGRFRIVSGLAGSIICYMEMQQPERVYRFTLYLKNKLFENKYLYGVYAGIEYKKDYPIAGRIRLEKTEINFDTEINSLIVSEECFEVPKDSEKVELGLRRLLIEGNHDNNYLDIIKNDKISKSIQNYVGVYSIYQASTRNHLTVVEHPLRIDQDGRAILYNDNKWKFIGQASYSSKGELSIYFDRRVENKDGIETYIDVYMHYLFSIKDNLPSADITKKGGLKLAYGVSSKFNRKEKPVARAVILSFESKELANFSPENFRQYQIGTNEYYELDNSIEKSGILTNLLGDYNRSIIFGSHPDKVKVAKKPEEYRNIHFFSACYWGNSFNENQSLEGKLECIRQLYYAYVNGFDDINLMKEEMSKSLAIVIKDTRAKARPNNFDSLPELTAIEIINKITDHVKNKLVENL